MTPSYAAFVLPPRGRVGLIYLGGAQPIDDAALALREAILAGHDPTEPGQALRRLVWDPVQKALASDTRTVYVCPDSVLTTVPWAALPQDAQGTPLLAKYAFAVVTSSSFLLEQLGEDAAQASESGRFLAVGDVAFGEQPDRPHQETEVRPRALVREDDAHAWSQLPATKHELAEIVAVAVPRTVVTLQGAIADTTRVANQLSKARWAHFATHGYFAHPRFRSKLQARDEESGDELFLGLGGERTSAVARNPMLLSGLALAGANLSVEIEDFATDDGGILTADRISFLDLEDLELAVLSACDTGLGDVAGGEGVLGLQRAFHAAGTKNVIASLWQVEDNATAVLMKLFYYNLWREDKPPLEALGAAQLTLYRSPQLLAQKSEYRGIDFTKTAKLPSGESSGPAAKETTPLRLWAAFVLSGAGR